LALAENTPSNVTLSKDKTGIEVADTMLDVSVKKTAKDTGKSLEGSSFKVSGTFVSGTDDIEGSAESLEAQLKGNLYASDPSADKSTWHVYKLQETAAPKGYILEKKKVSFIIDETSRVTVIDDEDKAASISEGNSLTVTDVPTEVSILKTDKDGNALSNAKFTVNGAFADGSSSISFTSSSEAKKYSALFITGNTYTLTETEAPEGYEKLSAGIVFKLDEDGNVILKDSSTAKVKDDNTIQVTDVKKEVIADTGDSSNIAAQIAILISSLVLAAGMIMYRRKKLS
jgi:LPXTG-motif cell wall-anchored protein